MIAVFFALICIFIQNEVLLLRKYFKKDKDLKSFLFCKILSLFYIQITIIAYHNDTFFYKYHYGKIQNLHWLSLYVMCKTINLYIQ